jgi:beta-glucosidase/6-phospho-beta-glucosidase/beta-galactosidase
MLNWIAREYGNPPVLVIENGVADNGGINDRVRVDFHIVSCCVVGFT